MEFSECFQCLGKQYSREQSEDFLPVLLVRGYGEDCLSRFLHEALLRVCSTL